MMAKVVRNSRGPINRKKVCSLSDTVHINDFHSQLTSPIAFKPDSPHASVPVRFIIMEKPVDKGTWKSFVLVMEREKQENPPDFHPFHPLIGLVKKHKYSITALMSKEWWCWPNVLSLQATCPRDHLVHSILHKQSDRPLISPPKVGKASGLLGSSRSGWLCMKRNWHRAKGKPLWPMWSASSDRLRG